MVVIYFQGFVTFLLLCVAALCSEVLNRMVGLGVLVWFLTVMGSGQYFFVTENDVSILSHASLYY